MWSLLSSTRHVRSPQSSICKRLPHRPRRSTPFCRHTAKRPPTCRMRLRTRPCRGSNIQFTLARHPMRQNCGSLRCHALLRKVPLAGEWLIDPKEWLDTEKSTKETPPAPPTPTDTEPKGELTKKRIPARSLRTFRCPCPHRSKWRTQLPRRIPAPSRNLSPQPSPQQRRRAKGARCSNRLPNFFATARRHFTAR